MYSKGQKISAFFFSRTLGHNTWANGTILGPADVMVTDVIRDAYRVELDNGQTIDKVPADCLDVPMHQEN